MKRAFIAMLFFFSLLSACYSQDNKLQFRLVLSQYEAATVEHDTYKLALDNGGFEKLSVSKEVLLSNPEIKRIWIEEKRGSNYIELYFGSAAANEFERITAENVNKRLAIIYNDQVLIAPNIREPIVNGMIEITTPRFDNSQEAVKFVKELGFKPVFRNRGIYPNDFFPICLIIFVFFLLLILKLFWQGIPTASLFAISLIYFPLILIYFLFSSFATYHHPSLMASNSVGYFPLIGFSIKQVFTIFLMLAIIIGVLLTETWAYYMFTGLLVYHLVGHAKTIIKIIGLNQSLINFKFGVLLFSLIYLLFLLFYFFKSDVKECFLKKDLKGKYKSNWSVVLLFLGWWIIIFGVEGFARSIIHGIDLVPKAFVFGWSYRLIEIILGVGLLMRIEIIRKISLGFFSYSIFLTILKANGSWVHLWPVILGILYILILIRPQVTGQFK